MYFNWRVQTAGTPSGEPFINNLLIRLGYPDIESTYTKSYTKYAKSYRCKKPFMARSKSVKKRFYAPGALRTVTVRKWVVRCKSGGVRSVRRVPFRAILTFESVQQRWKGTSFYKQVRIG